MNNKKELLNEYAGKKFIDFLKQDQSAEILKLLDKEGIFNLSSSKYLDEKIVYLLDYSKYINELLLNDDFLNLFMSINFAYVYKHLSKLNEKSCDRILEFAQRKNLDLLKIIPYLSSNYNYKKITSMAYDFNTALELLQSDISIKCKNQILEKYPIHLTDMNIYDFFKLCKKTNLPTIAYRDDTLYVSPRLFTKDFLEKLVTDYDTFMIREIIQNADFVTDTDIIERYIEDYEVQKIESICRGELLEPYKTLDKKLDEIGNAHHKNDKIKIMLQLVNAFNEQIKDEELKFLFRILPDSETIQKIKNRIIKINNNELSNFIIDYHFKENFHNVLIDIKELLTSYYLGNIKLSNEKVLLYKRILSIDTLSISDKKQLFEDLKSYNVVEMFYDDMSFARKMIREAVKDNLLQKNELDKHLDNKLSKRYGVPVYNFDGEPFFALIKSGKKENEDFPRGYSYSMIGNGCIAVFLGNFFGKGKNNTFAYDTSNLNPEQIVHIFPFDSFTNFSSKSNARATNRVNVLMNSNDLLATSGNTYNEILIMESGTVPTQMDDRIPELQKMALYCVNEITDNDILTAQKDNLGIILINSSKYKKPLKKLSTLYSNTNSGHSYYDEISRIDFENMRKNGAYKI